MSPTLFKVYVAETLKQWKRQVWGMIIQLTGDVGLYTYQFTDDQVLLANDKKDMEYMLGKLIEEHNKLGYKVNVVKMKYLYVGETQANP